MFEHHHEGHPEVPQQLCLSLLLVSFEQALASHAPLQARHEDHSPHKLLSQHFAPEWAQPPAQGSDVEPRLEQAGVEPRVAAQGQDLLEPLRDEAEGEQVLRRLEGRQAGQLEADQFDDLGWQSAQSRRRSRVDNIDITCGAAAAVGTFHRRRVVRRLISPVQRGF
jgi:hypothetical protein